MLQPGEPDKAEAQAEHRRKPHRKPGGELVQPEGVPHPLHLVLVAGQLPVLQGAGRVHLLQSLQRHAEHPQNLAHGLILPLVTQSRAGPQLVQLPAQLRVLRPVQLPLGPAEQLRQLQQPGGIRFTGLPARGHKVIGEIVKPLEQQHEQIVHLAVAVGQVGISPAAVDDLGHVDHHGRQRGVLGAHALAPGQLFQLGAQVVHALAHGAEMPAPVNDLCVNPQRRRDHHQTIGQHRQLHRQLGGRDGHQLQKDKLHAINEIGLGAEFGAEQIHQHKGHHQIQCQCPPETPPGREGRQAHRRHHHRRAGQLPGAEVLPVTGAEYQGQKGGHHHIPHPEDAPDAEQQGERYQNGGQRRRPPGANGRQLFLGELGPGRRPFSPAHRIRRRTMRSLASLKGGKAVRMGNSPRCSTLR